MTSLGDVQDATFASASPATASSYPPERRLPGETLQAVLTSRLYAVLSTTRPDGRPHSAPTSFVLADSQIWMPTVRGAARARNARQQPYGVLVLAEGEHEHHMAVIAEGPLRVVDSAPASVADEIAVRLREAPDWVAHWLVLEPRRVLSYAAEEWALS
jgi:hypothetical protein